MGGLRCDLNPGGLPAGTLEHGRKLLNIGGNKHPMSIKLLFEVRCVNLGPGQTAGWRADFDRQARTETIIDFNRLCCIQCNVFNEIMLY